jgi:hypothetical protein
MEERPGWDDARAETLLGKHVLVGLTYCDHDGEIVEHAQYYGSIVSVDAEDGIAVDPAGAAELFWLPPDLLGFSDAPPGVYRLRASGEVVLHPDLLSTWTITAPPPHRLQSLP